MNEEIRKNEINEEELANISGGGGSHGYLIIATNEECPGCSRFLQKWQDKTTGETFMLCQNCGHKMYIVSIGFTPA